MNGEVPDKFVRHSQAGLQVYGGGGSAQVQVYSRLRCVEGVGAVPNILSAVKDSVGQTSQEVSGRQITGDGSDREPGPL